MYSTIPIYCTPPSLDCEIIASEIACSGMPHLNIPSLGLSFIHFYYSPAFLNSFDPRLTLLSFHSIFFHSLNVLTMACRQCPCFYTCSMLNIHTKDPKVSSPHKQKYMQHLFLLNLSDLIPYNLSVISIVLQIPFFFRKILHIDSTVSVSTYGNLG